MENQIHCVVLSTGVLISADAVNASSVFCIWLTTGGTASGVRLTHKKNACSLWFCLYVWLWCACYYFLARRWKGHFALKISKRKVWGYFCKVQSELKIHSSPSPTYAVSNPLLFKVSWVRSEPIQRRAVCSVVWASYYYQPFLLDLQYLVLCLCNGSDSLYHLKSPAYNRVGSCSPSS